MIVRIVVRLLASWPFRDCLNVLNAPTQ